MGHKRGFGMWFKRLAVIGCAVLCLGVFSGTAGAVSKNLERNRGAVRVKAAPLRKHMARSKQIQVCGLPAGLVSRCYGAVGPQGFGVTGAVLGPSATAAATVAGAVSSAASKAGGLGQPSLGQVGGVQGGASEGGSVAGPASSAGGGRIGGTTSTGGGGGVPSTSD